MDLSQPLITPEELHCLLGWPLPVSPKDSRPTPLQTTPATATQGTPDTSLAMAD